MPYSPKKIEKKWQKAWEESGLFQGVVGDSVKDKLYLLFAFAYPSGSGLHVGHAESMTALDILARYNRMNGRDVFFPVGWDAFGLPAENYAIKTGVPPAETTKKAIDTFRGQIKRLGVSYDWTTELATSHPEYYKWTQWLFLELYKKGLAYKAPGMVNWCPSCQTVLANEQVVNGECERCGHEVVQKSLEQWYFKITDYKDELISGLGAVDWPAATEKQQRDWIGKQTGALVEFEIKGDDFSRKVKTFTTRVDTIYGVTFLAVSPEKVREWEGEGYAASAEVKAYIDDAFKKTEEERKIGEKKKTGKDTGLVAVNPVNGDEVPVYVADYVLACYGTGVVMGVPAHDGRDFEFARKFKLPVVQVIYGGDVAKGGVEEEAAAIMGKLMNSDEFDEVSSKEAMEKIPEKFDEIEKATTYKLRDWLISRQRYWGAPIPIVYDPDGKAHPVKEEHLPWKLPEDVDFKPTGESPLKSSKEFVERVEKLYGKGWKPEFDTMDTFVDSSWYYLRYATKSALENQKAEIKNQNDKAKIKIDDSLPFDQTLTREWLPVDFYMIGPEHIVLHLLYSRFLAKFLRDQGYLEFDEPFTKMRHQGMILGPDHKKMSKSKGNVIDPDGVIDKFGADTLRVYEMFMGPIDADKPWNPRSVVGIYRFLSRIWDLVNRGTGGSGLGTGDKELEKALHKTVKAVSEDLPELKFNTAIARMMEFVNEWQKTVNSKQRTVNKEQKTENNEYGVLSREDLGVFVRILAPFAPHMAEELWEMMRKREETETEKSSVHLQEWPKYDAELAKDDMVTIPVQVNGKVRGQVEVEAEKASDKEYVLGLARAEKTVAKWLKGGKVAREIWVPGRLINFVVRA